MTIESEAIAFWASTLILTLLSATGSLYIVVSVLLKFRTDFSARLVLYLSIADFALSIVCFGLCLFNLSNGHIQKDESFACKIQPIVTWFFMEASIVWLVVIALNSYKIIFHDNSPLTLKQEIAAHTFAWGLPFVTTMLPLGGFKSTGESYGHRNGLWCSFAEDQKIPQMLNLLAYYIPALVVILFCYIRIGFKIRQLGKMEQTGSGRDLKIKATRKMFLYVLSYFIVWSPLVLCYIYEAATKTYIAFWTEYISDQLLHISGILNFILYGITEDLLRNSIAFWRAKYFGGKPLPKVVELPDLSDTTLDQYAITLTIYPVEQQ